MENRSFEATSLSRHFNFLEIIKISMYLICTYSSASDCWTSTFCQ